MTKSPSEKETKRQLEAIFAKAKARAKAHPEEEGQIAADLLAKAIVALSDIKKEKPKIEVTPIPVEDMAAALNELKHQFYSLIDNYPIHEDYKGDLMGLVITSIFEDCMTSMGLPKTAVPSYVLHIQGTLHHNFETEKESRDRTSKS